MITLKEYQVKAVDELTNKALTLLSCSGRQQKLIFKAPTGSGKTVMTGAWLQKMARTLPGQLELPQRRFAYIWIAPNQLHQQSLTKLSHYFEETRDLRCLEFDDLADDALAENDLLFFNWQSITRNDNIFIRDNEHGRNLSNLMEKTKSNGIEIIAVLDEAHFYANAPQATTVRNVINAKIEVDVSATPVFNNEDIVIVKRESVVQAEMIKKKIELNPGVRDTGEGDALNDYLLKIALKKRADLLKRYMKTKSTIRPLLLIQLPSDNKAMSEEDKQLRVRIEAFLEVNGINRDNGKLAVWLSDNKDKINLDGIEKHDSVVEVLLFKQAIAIGWDCPRAAVLLIFREIHAEVFAIQTVGRILRMPEHRHYSDDILNYGYVYTNLSRDIITISQDDMDYIFDLKSLRSEFYSNIDVESNFINRRANRNRLNSSFYKSMDNAAKNAGWLAIDEDLKAVEKNRLKAAETFFSIEPGKITVSIPKDVCFDGDHTQVVQAKTTRFAKTTRELESMLHKFCQNECGDYAKIDSAPILKQALLEFMENYFGIYELDATRIILAEHNALSMRTFIISALEEYKNLIAKKIVAVTPKSYLWEVPEEQLYRADQYVEKMARKHHVLQPAYSQNSESCQEVKFAHFLESHAKCLEWWYKNGDYGKEYFAVPYRNAYDEWALFYVDFLIKFKDGTLGFFDTKTLGSDPEAHLKHNALLDYLQRLEKQQRVTIGGIIIDNGGDGIIWRYCKNRLAPGFDLVGWNSFNPKDYEGGK